MEITNEKKLAAHIKKLSEVGFSLDQTKFRQLAFEFAESLNIEHRVKKEKQMAGFDWLWSFMRRNPDLSIRKAEGLFIARAKDLSREEVQKFYDLLEREVNKYKLQNMPQNISNVDESGLQLINTPGEVIAAKGSKAVNVITTGERGETVTLIACCTAEG